MHEPPIKSQFGGQFRIGRVSSTDASNHRVTVQFFEQDGFTVEAMSMLVTRKGDYSLPEQDDLVLCLLVDGRLGNGYVLGSLYSDSDAAPLSDAGQRSIASDDLRLGDPGASDKIALAPPTNDGLTALWNILDGVCGDSAPPVNEAGNGGASSLQAAFKIAIDAQKLANKLPPADVAAEKVKAK